jgi:hypothetical protein
MPTAAYATAGDGEVGVIAHDRPIDPIVLMAVTKDRVVTSRACTEIRCPKCRYRVRPPRDPRTIYTPPPTREASLDYSPAANSEVRS